MDYTPRPTPGRDTAPARFTKQLVIMVEPATFDRIDADRKRAGLSKSEVARTYLEAGIDLADAGDDQ